MLGKNTVCFQAMTYSLSTSACKYIIILLAIEKRTSEGPITLGLITLRWPARGIFWHDLETKAQ